MSFLASVARWIDRLNQVIGASVAWIALFMVMVQFFVVILRYVFGYGSIFMQESIIYMHGFLFLLGAAYTLLHDGHVRVDVLYREASPQRKAAVNLFGVVTLLTPVCAAMIIYVWPYVGNSWQILEQSKETSGIPAIFVLKTAILVFLILMLLQGLSIAIHSFRVLTGQEEPPAEEEHEVL